MTAALRAEWTKVRTVRGTKASLLLLFVLMVALGAVAGRTTETQATLPGQGDDDVVSLALFGLLLAQIAAVTLGAALITSEFAGGMIRTTFAAIPRRGTVIAAKAVVLTLAAFPVALLASAVAVVVAQPALHDSGYVAPAYPPASLGDAEVIRAVFGTALLLTAFALLAFGIGAIVRHSGATIVVALALLFLPLMTPTQKYRREVQRVSPVAGWAIQSTNGRMPSMLTVDTGVSRAGMWTGLGVTFAWAAGALLIGAASVRRRDA